MKSCRVVTGRNEDVLIDRRARQLGIEPSTLGRASGSPGGARPKALIALNEGGHAVHGSDEAPEGYEHYLVKFPGYNDPDDIAAIEMAYADMAKEAGVSMPETRLLDGGCGTCQGQYLNRR